MNSFQLQDIKDRFYRYTKGYLQKSGPMLKMMELKQEHCEKVAENCRTIAQRMNWPEEEVNTAEALGYLHDIGRFPQLERFATFVDANSVNHGKLGFQILKESNLLDNLEQRDRERILCSVLHHNAKRLPENLSHEHYPMLKMIRDADKMDIFRVVLHAVQTKTIEEHPEIGRHLSMDLHPNHYIIEKALKKQPISYSELKCFGDFLLMLISWAKFLNYPASLNLICERKIIRKLKDCFPVKIPEVEKITSDILKQANKSPLNIPIS